MSAASAAVGAVSFGSMMEPASADIGGAVPLWILHRRVVGGVNRFSSVGASPHPIEGSVAYIPTGAAAGRVAMRRFYKATVPDHRDSTATSIAGYTHEGILGYPWTSPTAVPGLDAAKAIVTGHAGTEHASYLSSDPIAGYADDATIGYGYPRYGADADGIDLLTVSGGGVTIGSNRIAGGAAWSWVHNGVEHLDTADYGRLLQAALFFTAPSSPWNAPKQANPTEGGGQNSSLGTAAPLRHGSPLLLAENPTATTQSTRAIPLEWLEENWGGSTTAPVIWPQVAMGKDITLDFAGLGPVVKYETVLSLPGALNYWPGLPPLVPPRQPSIVCPTGYMPASFNRFWRYEPGEDADPVQVLPGAGSENRLKFRFIESPVAFPSGYGSVIITNEEETHGMGVYAVADNAGGTATSMNLIWMPNNTSIWEVWTGRSSFPAGETRFRTYICSGSLADIKTSIDALRAMDAK